MDQRRSPGNLPAQTGIFLGRGHELVNISKELKHPPAVVVISGPPGIGKTSLVLEAAHRNAYRFPGGVAYARAPRLEDIRKANAAEILKALAEALGITPASEKRVDELLYYTSIKPALLLIDNLETLPVDELAKLGNFLRLLGGESAAIAALRPSSKILEDLPTSSPSPCTMGYL